MPECFLDTSLVEVLLECSDAVNHKKGNSSVIKIMSEGRLRNNFVVAVIDDDKVKVKGLEDFVKIEKLCKAGLKFFNHSERNHYIIQLSPAIELWLLNECSKGDVNLSLYDLPGSLKGLRSMKGISQRKDERFKRLFRDMLNNDKCDEIIELKRWLIFFRDNNYNSNLDLL
jgi:hypothetical protein